MPQIVNDLGDFVLCHAISGFFRRSFGHSPIITIDATVSRQEQFWVVQQSIHALQRQPFLAPFT